MDKLDTKVKHLSGVYLHLPEAPDANDIKYVISNRKLKILTVPRLKKIFGNDKEDRIMESLAELVEAGYLKQGEDKYTVNDIT